MSRLENLKETMKERARLAALSTLFLMVTTFVSCFCIYLPYWFWPDKYAITTFDLGSMIVGSFMGQVTLLMAMSMISRIFKKEDEPEDIPAQLNEVTDLPDIEGP